MRAGERARARVARGREPSAHALHKSLRRSCAVRAIGSNGVVCSSPSPDPVYDAEGKRTNTRDSILRERYQRTTHIAGTCTIHHTCHVHAVTWAQHTARFRFRWAAIGESVDACALHLAGECSARIGAVNVLRFSVSLKGAQSCTRRTTCRCKRASCAIRRCTAQVDGGAK